MKIKEILYEESKLDLDKKTTDKKVLPNKFKISQDYYIVYKKNRYFVIDKDGKIAKNERGYESLEDTLDVALSLTSDAYRKATLEKKISIIDKKKHDLIKWNKEVGKDIESMKSQKLGFYQF